MKTRRLAIILPPRGLRRAAQIDVARAHASALERRRLVNIGRTSHVTMGAATVTVTDIIPADYLVCSAI